MRKLLAAIACYALLFPQLSLAQGLGNVVLKHYPGVPTGGCSQNQMAIDNANGALYVCYQGAWLLSGSGGSVTNITTTFPITGGPITGSGTLGFNANLSASGCVGTDSNANLASNTNCATSAGSYQPQYIAPQAISGCGVEWTGLLTFTVGACSYVINGVSYTSPAAMLTLSAADPSNPRIDVLYVDTTSTAQVLTGTPAVSPVAPTVDVSTQLALTFVTVAANATTPSNFTVTNIYLENTEWTTAAGGTNSARVNLASTNNPYQGTKDIEFGNGGTVTTTTYAQATKPASGTVDLGTYNALVFYIRNKAAWPANRSVTVQWFNGATAKGNPIVLSQGAFGFNATLNTTSYQQVSIPAGIFGINGVPVTTVRFTVSGTGAALTGFYLDEITLQAGSAGPTLPTTLMNFRGTYSAAVTYQPNDVVINSGDYYVALVQNLNVAVTTSGTWAAVTSTGTGSAVRATSPTLVTPTLGAATATSVTSASYLSATNCAATGTAASPSVVSCSAAPMGSFSCATNASTATCVVDTTIITANSEVFIQPTAAAGTKLSVTCNTTSDTGLTAPRLASISASTSFTINLGTFSTNPLCFNYWIVN